MRIRSSKTLAGIIAVLVFIISSGHAGTETDIDPQLLEKVERDSFRYFLNFTPRKTGFTRDSSAPNAPCSIAAVGFYLASLVVAAHNKWLSKNEVRRRITIVLQFAKKRAQRVHGFYYHFLDPLSGKRVWGSEASSIDTALFMAGVLLAGEYFKGTDIESLAQELYADVEWDWMRNSSSLICHGYTPERGFLPYYWDTYSEHLILQALAIGSPTHPAPPAIWQEWNRYEEYVNDKRVIYCLTGSLFTYQFSHAFIDFRKIYDLDINYFDNSIYASEANRDFCINNTASFSTYKRYWGLTACLGPNGYKAYGAHPGNPIHDGTIAPYGAISSLPFTPQQSFQALKRMYRDEHSKLYGRYGFKDAFNKDRQWYAKRYIAIDQGITILMIENYRSGLIWKHFMDIAPIQKWIHVCDLKRKKPQAE